MNRIRAAVIAAIVIACAVASTNAAHAAAEPLSPPDVVKARDKTTAFQDVSSKVRPVINKRLQIQENKLTAMLEKLSDAEAKKDMVLAAKLADQLGAVELELEQLHTAQADLGRLGSINGLVAADVVRENPSGQICQGEHCTEVPAIVAIISILTAGLTDELNKKQPFGPNNEIMKALHSIGDFFQCIFGCR
jgi:hypothetical protein